jgi:hypothetical protein
MIKTQSSMNAEKVEPPPPKEEEKKKAEEVLPSVERVVSFKPINTGHNA